MTDFDVCIIGSGAGAGPVAYTLSKAGYKVVVLEKGKWYNTSDFYKDEMANCRRNYYTPSLLDEPQIIEKRVDNEWIALSNKETGRSFWNGNVVGGSTNFMGGYFYRLKPIDFRLMSEFGPIEGANIVDWPISYEELEPYYAMVEEVVGVSGKVSNHPHQEPRSTKKIPFDPLNEHPLSSWFDDTCRKLNYHSIPTPRAIISKPYNNRTGCSYSMYCEGYGCSTGAKGGARAALLEPAFDTGNCEIRPESMVYEISTNETGKITGVSYFDKEGNTRQVDAKIYVVACQSVETSRLLLNSKSGKFPKGLANNQGQVGKNLLFAGGGSGGCDFDYNDFSPEEVSDLKIKGPFVNRCLQDWYVINDKSIGDRVKGGTINFMMQNNNPIQKANTQIVGEEGLVWGMELKKNLEWYFRESTHVEFEIFNDWLPNDNCFISIDEQEKDRWGKPVAKIRLGFHEHNLKVGNFLAEKAKNVLSELGGKNITSNVSSIPLSKYMTGGCRFGNDPKTSVLDKNCRAHEVENLFITDGSWMPTGGSVPPTWTIYTNAFRVADVIVNDLGGKK